MHMVQLHLDVARLAELGRRERLPRDVDFTYLAHLGLVRLFGSTRPQPWHLATTRGRWAELLGYSAAGASELREAAQLHAEPEIYLACDWDRFACKPIPDSWTVRRRFGFETRICPVVRMAGDGPHHRKGNEVDAFLAACWKVGDKDVPVSREEVYRDWLTKRLEAAGARVLGAQMTQFRLERLLRRTHGARRVGRHLGRPAASFRGTLEVGEPSGFGEMLSRGIGRHRAFGFGMVLLRPPPRSSP